MTLHLINQKNSVSHISFETSHTYKNHSSFSTCSVQVTNYLYTASHNTLGEWGQLINVIDLSYGVSIFYNPLRKMALTTSLIPTHKNII